MNNEQRSIPSSSTNAKAPTRYIDETYTPLVILYIDRDVVAVLCLTNEDSGSAFRQSPMVGLLSMFDLPRAEVSHQMKLIILPRKSINLWMQA
jgi:hypothetical protein